MLKKNLALIGIGYWGKVHLKYLSNFKNVQINKIFYLKNKRIIDKKIKSKYIFTNNINEILNDKKIDFIDIVTPIETHSKLVTKFLYLNKKILVEKPLLMNTREIKEIELLQKKNNNLIVSYPYLFSKTLNHAKKIINSNLLGKIKYVEINMKQCGRFMKYGVNHLLGPHAISILSLFYNLKGLKYQNNKIIQKGSRIETSLISFYNKKRNVSNINLSLNYARDESVKEINIYCEKGTIHCDLNNKNYTLKAYSYESKKVRNYNVATIKLRIKKKYDEKNNMKYSIENFLKNNLDKNNFFLTKFINKVIS